MGNSTATNILNSYTNAMISVANNVTQDCSFNDLEQQRIFINNCGDVLVEDISISRTLAVDQQCIQSSLSTNNVDQQLTLLANQMAEAINNNLNIAGTADAANITNLSVNLSSAIKNEAIQDCSSLFGATQNINIDCAQANVTSARVSGLASVSTGEIITTCLQRSNNVSSIKQQLQIIIDQK